MSSFLAAEGTSEDLPKWVAEAGVVGKSIVGGTIAEAYGMRTSEVQQLGAAEKPSPEP